MEIASHSGHRSEGWRGGAGAHGPARDLSPDQLAPQPEQRRPTWSAGFLGLHPFRTLYVADLDAIEGTGDNEARSSTGSPALSGAFALGRQWLRDPVRCRDLLAPGPRRIACAWLRDRSADRELASARRSPQAASRSSFPSISAANTSSDRRRCSERRALAGAAHRDDACAGRQRRGPGLRPLAAIMASAPARRRSIAPAACATAPICRRQGVPAPPASSSRRRSMTAASRPD